MSKNEKNELGQFIPLHYHYNMLQDKERMERFLAAINEMVKPGDTVLELGGGTGVLSFFAAQKAAKVFTVEYNPELVNEARRILKFNPGGEKIEIIHADASEYVPEKPVDIVICEMLHVGLLREKQTEVIHRFKENYEKKFGGHRPFFIPCATLNAVQPVQQDFVFTGYTAPVMLFQDPYSIQERTVELGAPTLYHQLMYEEPYTNSCSFDGKLLITKDGRLNALRVITKSVLAFSTSGSTDWHSQYLILPLEKPIDVVTGQEVALSFAYEFGAQLTDFKPIIS